MKYRRQDRKRLEKAIEACEEIIKRGYSNPAICEAQAARNILQKIIALDGYEDPPRFGFDNDKWGY